MQVAKMGDPPLQMGAKIRVRCSVLAAWAMVSTICKYCLERIEIAAPDIRSDIHQYARDPLCLRLSDDSRLLRVRREAFLKRNCGRH